MKDHRSIAARALRKGDKVIHPDEGECIVTKIRKSDGAVFIRTADGLEGTCSAEILKWANGGEK